VFQVAYFVKLLGAHDRPMPNDAWGQDGVQPDDEVRFPPKPPPTDVAPGDELVYYAVGGYKRLFGTVRVETAPTLVHHNNPVVEKRWPYLSKVTVRPDTKVRYVSSGPELEAIGVGLQEQIDQGVSHFEIGRPEFDRAVQLLRRAQDEEARKLKSGWRPQ
jgi:hypothetical protein